MLTRRVFIRACAVAILALAIFPQLAQAVFRRGAAQSGFNSGNFQLNLNSPGLGGDFPFTNLLKNSDGDWFLRDNTGTPSPADLDANAYPLPGSDAIANHSGVAVPIRFPAQANVGGNCIPAQVGVCISTRVNGIGSFANPGAIVTSADNGGTATVATGSTTTITFNQAQDFRAGMEVPIGGTISGVTATNGGGGPLVNGGTTGAWTICAAGLTPTTIKLCLNDQVTPLITTGTGSGTIIVSYGRSAVGVAANGRIVSNVSSGTTSINVGIFAQDATTPITYRNGQDGLVVTLQGSEEVRWQNCTFPDHECFGAAFLAKLQAGKPGVLRSLNSLDSNGSLEVKWADRKPISYFSWGSTIYDRVGGVYAGITTSVHNDYSVNLGSGAPVDGQQLTLAFDAAAVSVTSGANALVTMTAHGFSNGAGIYFSALDGGFVPGGVTASALGVPATAAADPSQPGFIYFVITTCGSCDANHFQFATTVANALAGTAVTTTSTGSNVVSHAIVIAGSATMTAGNTSIAWTNHLVSINEPVSFTGIGSLAFPFNNGVAYYVKTVPDSGHITVSATPGGAVVTPLVSGTYGAVRNPTLSLNGTTAISIKDDKGYGTGTVKSTQPIARSFTHRTYATFTYDAVLNVWIKDGGDASFGTVFFTSAWPPEIFLRLCNIIGAHPWFEPPAFTVDSASGITDYNTSLYAYVHVNAPSWMVPRFEVIPNEFWNIIFQATDIMSSHEVVYASTAGWSTNAGGMQIAGKIASVLGQAVHNEYGGTIDSTRYWATVGVQSFNFSQAGAAAANAPRLTSSDYIAQTTPAQSPYTKSAASNWATHVNSAQYFTPGYYGTPEGATLAAANAGGVIEGGFTAGTNILNVTRVDVTTSPVFGIGSTVWQGPGIVAPVVVTGGSSPNWTTNTTFATTVSNASFNYQASGSDATAVQTFIDSSMQDGTGTATFSGTTMTITGATGLIYASNGNGGDFILGSGVAPFTQVVTAPAGNQNGAYTVSVSQNIGPVAIQSVGVFSLPSEQLMYQRVFAYAHSFTNQSGFTLGLDGYEGGYSPDFTSSGSSLTDQLAARGKVTTSSPGSTTGIYGIVQQNCANFKAAGGQFCSLFMFTGTTPSSNTWSALDDLYQPAPTPVWNAYIQLP